VHSTTIPSTVTQFFTFNERWMEEESITEFSNKKTKKNSSSEHNAITVPNGKIAKDYAR